MRCSVSRLVSEYTGVLIVPCELSVEVKGVCAARFNRDAKAWVVWIFIRSCRIRVIGKQHEIVNLAISVKLPR